MNTFVSELYQLPRAGNLKIKHIFQDESFFMAKL